MRASLPLADLAQALQGTRHQGFGVYLTRRGGGKTGSRSGTSLPRGQLESALIAFWGSDAYGRQVLEGARDSTPILPYMDI